MNTHVHEHILRLNYICEIIKAVNCGGKIVSITCFFTSTDYVNDHLK